VRQDGQHVPDEHAEQVLARHDLTRVVLDAAIVDKHDEKHDDDVRQHQQVAQGRRHPQQVPDGNKRQKEERQAAVEDDCRRDNLLPHLVRYAVQRKNEKRTRFKRTAAAASA